MKASRSTIDETDHCSVMRILDIDIRFSVEHRAASPTQTRTWREVLFTLDLENFGTSIRCLSSPQRVSFHTEWRRSQVGQRAPQTPVGEPDVVVESQEYEGCAKPNR